jgi:hypothetical protein
MLGNPDYQLQQVTVRCPVTQLPLATGVQLNTVAFATSVFTNVRVPCPHCDGEHRWSTPDAFLVAFEGGVPPLQTFGRHVPPAGPKKPPAAPATER